MKSLFSSGLSAAQQAQNAAIKQKNLDAREGIGDFSDERGLQVAELTDDQLRARRDRLMGTISGLNIRETDTQNLFNQELGRVNSEIGNRGLSSDPRFSNTVGGRSVSTTITTLTETTGRNMNATMATILVELQQGHLNTIASNTTRMATALEGASPSAAATSTVREAQSEGLT